MIPDIIPIIQPAINWHTFLHGTVAVTGESPTRLVDSYPGYLSDPARFLAAISNFNHPELHKDVLAAIRDSRSLLGHLSYSFLVAADCEIICEIAQRNVGLIVTSKNEVAIMSGSLTDWRAASLEFCISESDFNIRLLFDKVVLHFEHIGLGDLWHGWRKKSMPDQTFLLEHRP